MDPLYRSGYMRLSLIAMVFAKALSLSASGQTTVNAPNQSLQSGMVNELNAKADTSSGLIAVGNNSSVAATPRYRNGIFAFSLTAVPSGQNFLSGTITLSQSSSFGSAPITPTLYDFYLLGFTNSPAVYPTTAIYKDDDIDQPTGDGIRVADNFTTFGNVGSLTISGTALVNALNTRPTGNSGDYVFFRINGDAPAPADFRSAAVFGNLGSSPTFSVTYGPAPEPSSVLLLASAAALLAGSRHRARRLG